MDKYKTFLTDLFFPKFCLGCQKEGIYLCDDCRALLEISEFNYCLCEKNPSRLLPNSKSGKCDKCQNLAAQTGKKLSGLFFALPYKEKHLTKKLIYHFKYEPYLKDLAKTLASILAEHFILTGKNTDDVWKNSILAPVPLDIKKLKNRGYNQSEELAKELSKIINVPVVLDVLIKIKETKPQMKLNKIERQKNLEGAFTIKNCGTSDVPQFLGKKVFLVDDVYTTGSTMQECAKVLRQANAKSVWGICLAREEL